jgi:hypothetical protein
MILSLQKVENSKSRILCFRLNSKYYQWKKKADLWWDAIQDIV